MICKFGIATQKFYRIQNYDLELLLGGYLKMKQYNHSLTITLPRSRKALLRSKSHKSCGRSRVSVALAIASKGFCVDLKGSMKFMWWIQQDLVYHGISVIICPPFLGHPRPPCPLTTWVRIDVLARVKLYHLETLDRCFLSLASHGTTLCSLVSSVFSKHDQPFFATQ